MSIDFKKYIDITSGVANASPVSQRELIGRLFNINPLLPPSTYLEFTSKEAVGDYFGLDSEEYKRAAYYFGYISLDFNRPDKISFARWVNANTAPKIYGKKLSVDLAALKEITNGSFTLTLGSVTHEISALDFSGAANFAAIATIIQTAINAETGMQWTAATVSYDATRGGFDFVGGDAVVAVLEVAAGETGTDISQTIGWYPEAVTGAIWSDGALAESITTVLTNSSAASDNFGSFLFMPTLTLDQIAEAAIFTHGENVKFKYMVPVNDLTDAQTYYDALVAYSGVCVTKILITETAQYPEMFDMVQLAATDYQSRNATLNYMYKRDSRIDASVTTTSESNSLDALRVNYFGETQTAGQKLTFYQRGLLMGPDTSPLDTNVFSNEQWLKSAMETALINLLLRVNKVSANAQGRVQLLTTLQTVINQALFNGVISIGGILTQDQIAEIKELSNDDRAYFQVQNIGYWLNVEIVPVEGPSNTTEYEADYLLLYKKDDQVRKVNGTQVLI